MPNFFTSEILCLSREIITADQAKEAVASYLASQTAFASTKNLSFFNPEYVNFPIEEIRRLQIEASYSPSFDDQDSKQSRRVFVLLNFDTAGEAAQNAALKIIEESPRDTLILLLVKNKEKILPTINSRCLIIETKQNQNSQNNTELASFTWPESYSQAIDLAANHKDRLQASNFIKNLLQAKPTKPLSRVQKQRLLQAYQDLERNQNVLLTLENCFFEI